MVNNLLNEWEERTLGDVCLEIAGGGTPSRKKKEYFGGTIPWVVVKDIVPEITETSEYLTKDGLNNSSAKLWPAGTVILSTGATIGKVGMAGTDLCTKQGVTGLVVNEKIILNKFLYYFLKTITAELKRKASGVTVKEIYKRSLREIKVPVPPLSVQKQIVAILEKAEQLKERRIIANEETQKIIQSLFAKIFGNPITNERKFPIQKLNDICDVRDGTHESPKYVEEGYPLVTSKNVKNGYIDFSDARLISKTDFDAVNKRSFVDDGDIIMPMIGTIGNPIIVKKDREFAIKNVALIKFSRTNVSNIYINALLRSPYFEYITQKNSRGGTQKFIALKDIRNFPIPLPSIELQNQFVGTVKKIKSLKEKQTNSTQDINQLFDALMQKAFNGGLVA